MSQHINLFNPDLLPQRTHFSAAAMVQSLALVLAAMLLLQVFAARQARSLEQMVAETNQQVAQRRDQLVALTRQFSDQGSSKKLAEEMARVEAQLRRRSELFAELKTSVGSEAEGFSPYLTALARRTIQGVWLTGVEIGARPNELVLRGRALSAELVPAYVRALSADPAFAGRTVSALQVNARAPIARPAGAPSSSIVEPSGGHLDFTLSLLLEPGRDAKGAS